MHRPEVHVRVHFFGTPSLECGGVHVSLARRPQCTVLFAMILLAEPNRRLSRKTIAAEIWPGDDELTAAANLRRHLSYLLQMLPADQPFVERDREAIWWCPPHRLWCDVIEFERGDVDAYRADFIDGSSHDWVVAQRERLRNAAVARLLTQADAHREADDDVGAIACARRATELDPQDEAVARVYLELLGEHGDLDAMDAEYRSLVHHLRDVDLEPAAETAAVVDRFRRLAKDAAVRVPRSLTSFVEPDRIDDVANLVSAHRLVSIVGPGGAGKTRLALEVAHRTAVTYVDGVYFGDLSTISEGDALADALCRMLDVPADTGAKGFARICTFFRNRRALVILDNCEQLVESCAWFVSDLLQAAPHVRVIATTREALALRAECCYAARPLSISAAERLFRDRGRDASGELLDTDAASVKIAAICERLDRLPLALELAAGMLGVVSLVDVERAATEGIGRIRSRDTTTPERHRSLNDVIAWSIGLLEDGERDAFTRLAVFQGFFTASDAEAVCGVDVSTLANLVGASVLVRENAIESRFVFLNSIGETARRMLAAEADVAALHHAHAAHFTGLAARSLGKAFWPSERAWLHEVDSTFPNVMQALKWTLFGDGDTTNGVRLACGLVHYFHMRGFVTDGAAWLHAAIARTSPATTERAMLEHRLSHLEYNRGNFEAALQHARSSRAVLERERPGGDLARALKCEANALGMTGRRGEGIPLLERALEIARRDGDLRFEAIVLAAIGGQLSESEPLASEKYFAMSLRRALKAGAELDAAELSVCVAAAEYIAGRYDSARELLERALLVFRDAGYASGVCTTACCLGDVSLMQGAIEGARDRYAQALESCEHIDDVLWRPQLLTGVAGVAIDRGKPVEAARLIGAARWEHYGITSPPNARVLGTVEAAVRNLLTPKIAPARGRVAQTCHTKKQSTSRAPCSRESGDAVRRSYGTTDRLRGRSFFFEFDAVRGKVAHHRVDDGVPGRGP